ncbi:Papain fold toxin 1, glutamine deamidase [Actinacidiphila yanglinensis]|uniref:NAD(+)--protein-arginine ADP-ribosyltransferase n=1 Tax=Actinacidiphila yanglinensis TaxID=310779 RepID=A0A1H6E1A4_9ACTN|nr:M91 family zinc metallopeptidase [Actinacidiphila yanglinensis]SEG91380.1 Papain fold toxin 1, glutamine deamidase [Actinacidiphila yanglinensis]
MAQYDTSQIRALGTAWLNDAQNLRGYLQTMHESVWSMSGAWTGKAGQAAQEVWNGSDTGEHNIWNVIFQAAWVAEQIGTSILDYADELEKTVKEINKSHLIAALATIFGLVLNIGTLGLAGVIEELATKVGMWAAELAADSAAFADVAAGIGQAVSFTTSAAIWEFLTLKNDILSQILASEIAHGPIEIDWTSEGMNLGLGLEANFGAHLGEHYTSEKTGEEVPVPHTGLPGSDLPTGSPHVSEPTFSDADTNSIRSWDSSHSTLVGPDLAKITESGPAKYGAEKYDLEKYTSSDFGPDVTVKSDAGAGLVAKGNFDAPGAGGPRSDGGNPGGTPQPLGGVRAEPAGPGPRPGTASDPNGPTSGPTRTADPATGPGRADAAVAGPAGSGRGEVPPTAGRGDGAATPGPRPGTGRGPGTGSRPGDGAAPAQVHLEPAPRSAQPDSHVAAVNVTPPRQRGAGDGGSLVRDTQEHSEVPTSAAGGSRAGDDANLATSAFSRSGDGLPTAVAHDERFGPARAADAGTGAARADSAGAGTAPGSGAVRAEGASGAGLDAVRRAPDPAHGAGAGRGATGGDDAAAPGGAGRAGASEPAGITRTGRGAPQEGAPATDGAKGAHAEPAPDAGSAGAGRPAAGAHETPDATRLENSAAAAASGAHEGAGPKDALTTSAEPSALPAAGGHDAGTAGAGHDAGTAGAGHDAGTAGAGHDAGTGQVQHGAAAHSHLDPGPGPVPHGTADGGAPGHAPELSPAEAEFQQKAAQWGDFRQEHEQKNALLLHAESHLESLHADLETAWRSGALKFADLHGRNGEPAPGAGHESAQEHPADPARWEQTVKDARSQWRADFTRQFRAELDSAGRITADAFERIYQDAGENAFRHLVRADELATFEEKFTAELDAYKANRFGYGDDLPTFGRAPSKYVFDKDLGTFVKDDAKGYGAAPGDGPPRPAGDLPAGDAPHEPAAAGDTAGAHGAGDAPIDFFRDRSHDFNALEQHYIHQREQIRATLDHAFHGPDGAGTFSPRTLGRLDGLLRDASGDLHRIAVREQDIRKAAEEAFAQGTGEEPRPPEVVDAARSDLARDLRTLHDEVFGPRAAHDAVLGSLSEHPAFGSRAEHQAFNHGDDGRGPRRQWILRSKVLADRFRSHVDKADFVHEQIALEKEHAEVHLAEHTGENSPTRLDVDGKQRLIGGYLKQVRAAAELHAGREQEGGHTAEVSAAEWTGTRDQLRATLPDRIRHEDDLRHEVVGAAQDFHQLLGDPRGTSATALHEDTVSRLGNDFRTDHITRFDELFAPEGHKTDAWLAHEAHHEDGFSTRLDDLRRDAVQWRAFKQANAERNELLLHAEKHLESLHQELEAAWNWGAGKFADLGAGKPADLGAGRSDHTSRLGHESMEDNWKRLNEEARWDQAVKDARWQWRVDFTRQFRAELDSAGKISAESFERIYQDAGQNAFRHLVRAEQHIKFADRFTAELDAYKANPFGHADDLPAFEHAPTDHVHDAHTGTFVKDDAKIYGRPQDDESFRHLAGGSAGRGTGDAPIDFFRDKSHDFNALEHYYLHKQEHLDGIVDDALRGPGGADGLTPETLGRIDAVLHDASRELEHLAVREQDVRNAVEDASNDLAWNGGWDDSRPQEVVDSVLLDFARDLRVMHDEVFVARAGHDAVFANGDGQGPRRQWILRTKLLAERFHAQVEKTDFVHAQVAAEKQHAEFHLGEHQDEPATSALHENGEQRLIGGYLKQVRAVAELHADRAQEGGVRPEASSGEWSGIREQLRATLPDRIRHEGDLRDVADGAADTFHQLVGDPESVLDSQLHEDTVSRLGNDFRTEHITRFDEILAPEGHHSDAWLAHESHHEDGFQSRLDGLRRQDTDAYRSRLDDLRRGDAGPVSGPSGHGADGAGESGTSGPATPKGPTADDTASRGQDAPVDPTTPQRPGTSGDSGTAPREVPASHGTGAAGEPPRQHTADLQQSVTTAPARTYRVPGLTTAKSLAASVARTVARTFTGTTGAPVGRPAIEIKVETVTEHAPREQEQLQAERDMAGAPGATTHAQETAASAHDSGMPSAVQEQAAVAEVHEPAALASVQEPAPAAPAQESVVVAPVHEVAAPPVHEPAPAASVQEPAAPALAGDPGQEQVSLQEARPTAFGPADLYAEVNRQLPGDGYTFSRTQAQRTYEELVQRHPSVADLPVWAKAVQVASALKLSAKEVVEAAAGPLQQVTWQYYDSGQIHGVHQQLAQRHGDEFLQLPPQRRAHEVVREIADSLKLRDDVRARLPQTDVDPSHVVSVHEQFMRTPGSSYPQWRLEVRAEAVAGALRQQLRLTRGVNEWLRQRPYTGLVGTGHRQVDQAYQELLAEHGQPFTALDPGEQAAAVGVRIVRGRPSLLEAQATRDLVAGVDVPQMIADAVRRAAEAPVEAVHSPQQAARPQLDQVRAQWEQRTEHWFTQAQVDHAYDELVRQRPAVAGLPAEARAAQVANSLALSAGRMVHAATAPLLRRTGLYPDGHEVYRVHQEMLRQRGSGFLRLTPEERAEHVVAETVDRRELLRAVQGRLNQAEIPPAQVFHAYDLIVRTYGAGITRVDLGQRAGFVAEVVRQQLRLTRGVNEWLRQQPGERPWGAHYRAVDRAFQELVTEHGRPFTALDPGEQAAAVGARIRHERSAPAGADTAGTPVVEADVPLTVAHAGPQGVAHLAETVDGTAQEVRPHPEPAHRWRVSAQDPAGNTVAEIVDRRQLVEAVRDQLGEKVTSAQVSYAYAQVVRAYGADVAGLDVGPRAEYVARFLRSQREFTGHPHGATDMRVPQDAPDRTQEAQDTRDTPQSATGGRDLHESTKKAKAVELPPEPARHPVDTASVADGIHIRWDSGTDPRFLETVQEDLRRLASKPTGRALLERIAAAATTSKLAAWQQAKVKIERTGAGTVIGKRAEFLAHAGNVTKPINSQWATQSGKGTLSLVRYNPNAWETADGLRPPFIGLAHELIHAYRNLNGLSHPTAAVDEAQLVGFGEYADLEFTENKIRAEHGLAPRRTYAGTVGPDLDDAHLPRTVGRAGPRPAGRLAAKGTGGRGTAGLLWNAGAAAREKELSEKHGVRIGPAKGTFAGHFSHSVLDRIDAVLDALPAEHVRDNPDLRYIEPGTGSGDGASAYDPQTRGIGIVRPALVPSWAYSELDRGSRAQRFVMDRAALSGYDGVPLAGRLGLPGSGRNVMAGVSDVLAHGNLLEWTIRHEVGHSVIAHRAWSLALLQQSVFGGWKIYAPEGGRVDEVADDVLRMAEIDDRAEVLDDQGRMLVDVLARELVPDVLRDDPKRLEHLVETFPGADARLRAGLERVTAFVRVALAQPWTLDDGGASTLTIGLRVHHVDPGGTWVSYLRAQRDLHAVSNYQFSSPDEWFPETYAAYHDPLPGPRERLHPAVREWFGTGLPELLAQEQELLGGELSPVPASPWPLSAVPGSPGFVGEHLVWAADNVAGRLYTAPEGVAIRVRGPRGSRKDGRTLNQLTAAAWQKLPERTRQDLHKERLDVAADPLTLAETDPALYQGLSNAGRILENGPIGTADGRNAVLTGLGRRDSLTRGTYWKLQDERDGILGLVAREELRVFRSGPTTRWAREQLVAEALDGTSEVEALRRLLDQHEGVVIGEEQAGTAAWRLLAAHMAELKDAGVRTVYLGGIRGDSYQTHLNHYLETGTLSPALEALVRHHDGAVGAANTEGTGLREVLQAARQHGVRLVGVDGYPARETGRRAGADRRFRRAAALNTYAAGLVRRDRRGLPDASGYLVVIGAPHTGAHPGPEHRVKVHGERFRPGEEFPGVDDLLVVPRVVQDQVGRFHPGPRHAETAPAEEGAQRVAGQDPVGEPVRATAEPSEEYAWIGKVNPLRGEGGDFLTNCVLSAIATDLSLADPERVVFQAPPSLAGEQGYGVGGDESGATIYLGRYRDLEPYPVAGPAVVLDAMRRAAPGQRGMVVVRGRTVAHVLNVVRDEGGVVFLDGQAGTVVPAPDGAVSFLPTTHGIPGFPLDQRARAEVAPATESIPLGAAEDAQADDGGDELEELLAQIELDLRRGPVGGAEELSDGEDLDDYYFQDSDPLSPQVQEAYDEHDEHEAQYQEYEEQEEYDGYAQRGDHERPQESAEPVDDVEDVVLDLANEGVERQHAEEPTNAFEAFLLQMKPLQDYAMNAGDRTSPDVDLVLFSYPGADNPVGAVLGNSGHAFLGIRVPGRDQAVVFGFRPGRDASNWRMMTGSVSGGVSADASGVFFDHRAEVLATYRITADQLTDGYLYAVSNVEASYHLVRYNCVVFAVNFVAAATGLEPTSSVVAPNSLVKALRSRSHREWAENPHVTRLTPADEARAFDVVRQLERYPSDVALRAKYWAGHQVTIDHQRPLTSGEPTGLQSEQFALLDHVYSMVALEFLSNGEEEARALSTQLGLKYGTLRSREFAFDRDIVAEELLAPMREFGQGGDAVPGEDAEVVVMADATGRPSVAVRVPGAESLVGFRFGPVEDVPDRLFTDSDPGSLFFDDPELVHNLGYEVLAVHRAGTRQVAAGYRYALEKNTAEYGNRPFGSNLNESGFVRGFLRAVTGDKVPSDFLRTLREGADRSWATAESPETELRPADRLAATEIRAWLAHENSRHWSTYPREFVEESQDWARFRVSVDHQRPLASGGLTPVQRAQAKLLASFATLIAAAYRSGGEAAALAESYRLGRDYGTLRLPAAAPASTAQEATAPAPAPDTLMPALAQWPDTGGRWPRTVARVEVGHEPIEMVAGGDFHWFATDEGGKVFIGNDQIDHGVVRSEVAAVVSRFRHGGVVGFRVHDEPGRGAGPRVDDEVVVRPPATGAGSAPSVAFATSEEDAERWYAAARTSQGGPDRALMAFAVIGADRDIALTGAGGVHVLGPVDAALIARERVPQPGMRLAGPIGASPAGESSEEYAWIGEVNPLRGEGGDFLTNCVLSAIATDLSLADPEGAVFQAPPSLAGEQGLGHGGDESGATIYLGRYRDLEPYPVAGPAVVLDAMRRAAPGQRGMVVVRGRTVAHVLNVVRDEGGVVFLDGQAGTVVSAPDGAVSFLPTTHGIPGFPLDQRARAEVAPATESIPLGGLFSRLFRGQPAVAEESGVTAFAPDGYYANPAFRSAAADRARFARVFRSYDRYLPRARQLAASHEELRDIPHEDLVALLAYTGNAFFDAVNKALRDGDADDLQVYDPHIKGVVSALAALPPYEGTVTRAIEIYTRDGLKSVAARYKVGATVEERSFVSTDAVRVTRPGNIFFTIESRTGRRIDLVSEFRGVESEVAFPPGTRFQVTKKTKRDGDYHITMREVVPVAADPRAGTSTPAGVEPAPASAHTGEHRPANASGTASAAEPSGALDTTPPAPSEAEVPWYVLGTTHGTRALGDMDVGTVPEEPARTGTAAGTASDTESEMVTVSETETGAVPQAVPQGAPTVAVAPQSAVRTAAVRGVESQVAPEAAARSVAESTAAVAPKVQALRYRERIALAKRTWEGPVAEEAARLEQMLLDAGPGARSLVIGAAPGEQLWAVNLFGQVRWLAQSTMQTVTAPQTAAQDEPVVSIDLDPRATLLREVPQLLQEGGGGDNFCEITVGANLKYVV